MNMYRTFFTDRISQGKKITEKRCKREKEKREEECKIYTFPL